MSLSVYASVFSHQLFKKHCTFSLENVFLIDLSVKFNKNVVLFCLFGLFTSDP